VKGSWGERGPPLAGNLPPLQASIGLRLGAVRSKTTKKKDRGSKAKEGKPSERSLTGGGSEGLWGFGFCLGGGGALEKGEKKGKEGAGKI